MMDKEEIKINEQKIVEKANEPVRRRDRRMRPQYPRFLIPIAVVLSVVLVLSAAFCCVPLGQNFIKGLLNKTKTESKEVTNIINETLSDGKITLLANSDTVNGVKLSLKTDLGESITDESAESVILKVKEIGFNTVFLNCEVLLNGSDYSLDKVTENDLNTVLAKCSANQIKPYINFVLNKDLLSQDIQKTGEYLGKVAASLKNNIFLAGVTVENLEFSYGNDIYAAYLNEGNYSGFGAYCEKLSAAKLKTLSYNFKKVCDNKYFGAFL